MIHSGKKKVWFGDLWRRQTRRRLALGDESMSSRCQVDELAAQRAAEDGGAATEHVVVGSEMPKQKQLSSVCSSPESFAECPPPCVQANREKKQNKSNDKSVHFKSLEEQRQVVTSRQGEASQISTQHAGETMLSRNNRE